jgi:hypothetical protein
MRRALAVLISLSVIFACGLALASDAGPVTDAPPAAAADDIAGAAAKVTEAAKALKEPGSPSPKKFLWAALIAAIANLGLSIVKRLSKLQERGKKWLPRIAVALGAVVGVCEYYLMGGSLFTAILYGGAPLGAIVIQELMGPVKSKSEAPEATEAPPA